MSRETDKISLNTHLQNNPLNDVETPITSEASNTQWSELNAEPTHIAKPKQRAFLYKDAPTKTQIKPYFSYPTSESAFIDIAPVDKDESNYRDNSNGSSTPWAERGIYKKPRIEQKPDISGYGDHNHELQRN